MLAAPAAAALFRQAIMESGTPGFGMPFRSLQRCRSGSATRRTLCSAPAATSRRCGKMSVPALLAADLKLHDRRARIRFAHVAADDGRRKGLPVRPAHACSRSAGQAGASSARNRFEFGVDGGTPPRPADRQGVRRARCGGARVLPCRPARPAGRSAPRARSTTRSAPTSSSAARRAVGRRSCPPKARRSGDTSSMPRPAAARRRTPREIPYAFGDSTFDHGLSLKPYWLNFIRTGDPNGARPARNGRASLRLPGACPVQRLRGRAAWRASARSLLVAGPHLMTFARRRFLQSALALPLLAAQRPPPGVDWNKWFHDWFGRDFGMIGYYAEDNAKLLASREPVDVVFLGDSITEGWHDKRPASSRAGGSTAASAGRPRRRWCCACTATWSR